MERHIDNEFLQLKEMILTTGGRVERAIDAAVQGLIERKPECFEEVNRIEEKINQAHIEIDEACIRLLARQSPVASDLRLVIAVMKINTDLERMGDQAVNITHNAMRYLEEPAVKPLVDIPRMAEEVKAMVKEALDAFVRSDIELAKKVLDRDDFVDALKDQVLRELVTYMVGDPKSIPRAINLILIARNLERLGDHATNIAEDVIFVVTGEDVRHGAWKPSPGNTN